jgi:leucyl/phenylalanyl-tRNA---protein transferase
MNRSAIDLAFRWESLDLARAPASGPVAFHDDLSPESLLEAYRYGLYPMPTGTDEQRVLYEITLEAEVASGRVVIPCGATDPYVVGWWSPDPRPLLPAGEPHLQRSLRQQLRNRFEWTTTLDACFDRVVEHCRAGREPRWLTDELVAALGMLHEAGHAHSVEVWDGDQLIGGTFGVRIGGIFSADSQFTLRSGAAKVAVADLARRFAEVGGVAVDVQHDGDHVRRLGARPVPRVEYLRLLDRHAGDGGILPTGRLPARRLAV